MGKVKKKRRSNGDGKRIFRSPKGVHHVCRKKALAAPLFLTTSARRAGFGRAAAWEPAGLLNVLRARCVICVWLGRRCHLLVHERMRMKCGSVG